MPTRPTASCTDRSNSPLGELDEPCPTSQRRVGSTNPTRSSNSSLGTGSIFLSDWDPPDPVCSGASWGS
ncbi:hypothetical protein DY000_02016288 [Brassica cretica]|uniref:Growth-regulating factor n=1 Tax=Brassica cretica TaxID=69181 RepID=A0ABQ7D5U4_BRACR|nr:hypothetical protein DY000_02016288 [Brassica cretica]